METFKNKTVVINNYDLSDLQKDMILNNDVKIYSLHGHPIDVYQYRPAHLIVEIWCESGGEKWIVQKLKK